MIGKSRARMARLVGATLVLGLLVSCGGGSTLASDPDAGAGAGEGAISLGTVTGFGSVDIEQRSVEGAPPHYFDDNAPGAAQAPDAVGLGQRLQLVRSAGGSVALVQPDLVGPVQAVSAGGRRFTVNGLQVRVNADSRAGPLTFFAGLSGPAGLHAGTMVVEVDGAFGIGADGKAFLQATRIVQRPVWTRSVRLTGQVAGLDAGATSFLLGGVRVRMDAHTQIYPVGSKPHDGQTVNVWSAQAIEGGVLRAGVVRVRSLLGASGAASIAGLLRLPASGGYEVAGIPVVPANSVVASQLQDLGQPSYVTVTGRVVPGADYVLATGVQPYAALGAPVKLRGNITGFVDDAHFLVRGVPVGASAASFDGKLGNGVFVDLRASVDPAAPSRVRALALRVLSGAPDGGTVDLQGTVSQYDPQAASFVLSWSESGVTMASMVRIARNAVFSGGTVEHLADGSHVEVQARQTSAGLAADNIVFCPASVAQGVLRTAGVVHRLGAGRLRVNGLEIRDQGVAVRGGVLADGVRADVQFDIDPRTGVKLARAITVDEH
ncbi:DUF5666 domain-containing protein [Thiomonas sp. FB-6]|uniref:DUF5666 domain-containing protein n=1 Tax=Thiomonas sp. FB-6 TaxID=1158291 RepID=UPI00037A1AB1|nr:DUF5666 domain-containing protein [Thiomonas sp. FB-6]